MEIIKKSNNLLEITAEIARIMVILAENGGELSTEIENQLDIFTGNLVEKVDSYAYLIDKLDSESEFYKKKADAFNRMAKSCNSLQDRLKERVKTALTILEKDEIEGDDFRFKLSTSKPKLIIDESILPSEYKMIIYEADREKISKDLAEGKEIPGARFEETKALRKYINRRK